MDVQVIILNSMLLFICSSWEVKMEWSGVGTWRVGGLLDRVINMLWMLLFFQRNLQRDKTGHFFCLFWNLVIAVLMFFRAIMHLLLVPWHNSWTDWFWCMLYLWQCQLITLSCVYTTCNMNVSLKLVHTTVTCLNPLSEIPVFTLSWR